MLRYLLISLLLFLPEGLEAAMQTKKRPQPNCWVIVDYSEGKRRSFYSKVRDEAACAKRANAHYVENKGKVLQKSLYKFGKVPDVR
jgi:hypothetical protein